MSPPDPRIDQAFPSLPKSSPKVSQRTRYNLRQHLLQTDIQLPLLPSAMEPKEWQDDVQQRFDALSSAMSGKKRVKRRELPEFSGEQSTDAEEWLDLANKLSSFNNIKVKADKDVVPEVVLWMGLSMTGIAHTWYTSLSHQILVDYKHFVTEFRSFFVHVNVHQHIADFHKRVQSPNESVTSFYLALQKYISFWGTTQTPVP